MSTELKSLAAQLDKNQAAEDEAVAYIEGLSEKMHEETNHTKILEYASLIGHVASAVAAQQASLAAISENLSSSEKAIKETCEGVTKAGVSKAKPKPKEKEDDTPVPATKHPEVSGHPTAHETHGKKK